jgi:hypothetical protein
VPVLSLTVFPPQFEPRHAQNEASSLYVHVVDPFRPIGGPASGELPLDAPPSPDAPLEDPLDDVLLVEPLPEVPLLEELPPDEDPLLVEPPVDPLLDDPLDDPPLDVPLPDDMLDDPLDDPLPKEESPVPPHPLATAAVASSPNAARSTV